MTRPTDDLARLEDSDIGRDPDCRPGCGIIRAVCIMVPLWTLFFALLAWGTK